MTASHITRFERAARQSPQAFAATVRQVTGHDPATVTAMLEAWAHLERGGALTPAHISMLQRAHPEHAAAVPNLCSQINGLPPKVRGDALLATVSGDRAVLEGRYADAGSAFKEVKALATDWQRESIAAEISDRREVNVDPDIRERTITREPVDPLSARAIIERTIDGDHGKLVRGIADGVRDGDPGSLEVLRGNLADKAADAIERLDKSDELSTRDVVAASFDYHEVEQIASDQLGIEPEAST